MKLFLFVDWKCKRHSANLQVRKFECISLNAMHTYQLKKHCSICAWWHSYHYNCVYTFLKSSLLLHKSSFANVNISIVCSMTLKQIFLVLVFYLLENQINWTNNDKRTCLDARPSFENLIYSFLLATFALKLLDTNFFWKRQKVFNCILTRRKVYQKVRKSKRSLHKLSFNELLI